MVISCIPCRIFVRYAAYVFDAKGLSKINPKCLLDVFIIFGNLIISTAKTKTRLYLESSLSQFLFFSSEIMFYVTYNYKLQNFSMESNQALRMTVPRIPKIFVLRSPLKSVVLKQLLILKACLSKDFRFEKSTEKRSFEVVVDFKSLSLCLTQLHVFLGTFTAFQTSQQSLEGEEKNPEMLPWSF